MNKDTRTLEELLFNKCGSCLKLDYSNDFLKLEEDKLICPDCYKDWDDYIKEQHLYYE